MNHLSDLQNITAGSRPYLMQLHLLFESTPGLTELVTRLPTIQTSVASASRWRTMSRDHMIHAAKGRRAPIQISGCFMRTRSDQRSPRDGAPGSEAATMDNDLLVSEVFVERATAWFSPALICTPRRANTAGLKGEGGGEDSRSARDRERTRRSRNVPPASAAIR